MTIFFYGGGGGASKAMFFPDPSAPVLTRIITVLKTQMFVYIFYSGVWTPKYIQPPKPETRINDSARTYIQDKRILQNKKKGLAHLSRPFVFIICWFAATLNSEAQ